jgi:hypothetical protein
VVVVVVVVGTGGVVVQGVVVVHGVVVGIIQHPASLHICPVNGKGHTIFAAFGLGTNGLGQTCVAQVSGRVVGWGVVVMVVVVGAAVVVVMVVVVVAVVVVMAQHVGTEQP